mgnify:CR=1 FL=1|tara:strand:+ start:462 stop:665 length:204 start_codon:yes stop_codon:yes gene_type:complete
MSQLLFHYTSNIGLKGIIESNKIWATSFKNKNDLSEFDYGSRLFSESIVSIAEKYLFIEEKYRDLLL